jgi:DNA replication and repair protein RecF
MACLHSLTLTAYRSYPWLQLRGEAGFNILTGPNGAGKTNILEAISLLSPGRGLRKAKLGELQQAGNPAPWAISARFSPGEDEIVIGTGRDPNDPDSARRVVIIDGRRTQQAELAEQLSVLWVTPAMDRLWTEAPSARRRLLDHLALTLDPAHATRLNRYEDALAERNRMLKDGRTDDRWLGSLEHTLASEGVAVAAARRELVKELSSFLSHSTGSDNLFPVPALSLEGIETWLDDAKALAVEDRLRDELAKTRGLDAMTGITSIGPHRSDLIAFYAEKNLPAALGSTGEQKALVLSLILAQAMLVKTTRKIPPILLLDEVGAHLDESRREDLYNTLISLGCQNWLSGADRSLFTPLLGRFLCYEIAPGIAREIQPV